MRHNIYLLSFFATLSILLFILLLSGNTGQTAIPTPPLPPKYVYNLSEERRIDNTILVLAQTTIKAKADIELMIVQVGKESGPRYLLARDKFGAIAMQPLDP